MKSRYLNITFFSGMAGLIIVSFFVGPRGLQIDGFTFKDAAVNWALGHGLVGVSTDCNPTLIPLLSEFPSTYTLLYALHAKVVGIGDYENLFFNLLICGFRAWLLFELIIKRFFTASSVQYQYLGTILIIIFFIYSPTYDRPEELSLGIFLLSVWIYLYWNSPYKLFVVFILAGMNAATVLFGGGLNGVYLAVIVGCEKWSASKQWFPNISEISQILIGFFLIPLTNVAICLWLDPDSGYRYFQASTTPYNLWFLDGDYVKIFRLVFLMGISTSLVLGSLIGCASIIIGVLVVKFILPKTALRVPALIMITGIIIVITVIYLVGIGKVAYQNLTIFSTIVLFSYFYYRFQTHQKNQFLIILLFAFTILAGVPRTLRDIYSRLKTKQGYENAAFAAANYHAVIPQEEYIILDHKNYFLFKIYHWRVGQYDSHLDTTQFKYVALLSTKLALDKSLFTLPSNAISRFNKIDYKLIYESENPAFSNTLDNILMRPDDYWEFNLYGKK
jgi:hypothetical protein